MQSILHPIIGPAGPEVADLTGKVAVVTGEFSFEFPPDPPPSPLALLFPSLALLLLQLSR
jgi:hypothetical protein